MKITEILNVEHGVFLGQLAHLEKLLAAEASPQILAAVVQTIGRGVAPHRDAEEKYLYPAIEEALGPGFPPLAVMESEHQEIEAAIRAAENGSISREHAAAFLEVLRGHIAKEINILFPAAEEAIPADPLVEMARHVHAPAGGPAGSSPPMCCHG